MINNIIKTTIEMTKTDKIDITKFMMTIIIKIITIIITIIIINNTLIEIHMTETIIIIIEITIIIIIKKIIEMNGTSLKSMKNMILEGISLITLENSITIIILKIMIIIKEKVEAEVDLEIDNTHNRM